MVNGALTAPSEELHQRQLREVGGDLVGGLQRVLQREDLARHLVGRGRLGLVDDRLQLRLGLGLARGGILHRVLSHREIGLDVLDALLAGLLGQRLRHSQAERGDLVTQTSLAPDAARQMRRLERAVDRLAWAVIFAGLLLGGVLLRGDANSASLGTALLAGSALALVWGLTRR